MFSRTIIFIASLGLATGCHDDFDNTMSEEFPAPPTTIINTKLSGSVVGLDGQSIEDYSVDWGSDQKSVEGKYFLADLQQVDQLNQTIWIEKDDQVISLGQLPLVENDINDAAFYVFDLPVQESLQQSVDIANRLTIMGTTSSNTVSYRSISGGSPVLSHGWSRLGILQALSDVSVHEISLPMDVEANIIGTGDYVVFIFDESEGRWIELDSEKSVTGSGYYAAARASVGVLERGEVIHNGIPISYAQYQLADERLSKSTAKGNWVQVLPSNANVNVDLLSPCLDQLSTQTITTTSSTSFVDLELEPETLTQMIETQVVDCDGDPVGNSAIQITDQSGDNQLYFYEFAEIQSTVLLCSNEFSIAAFDPVLEVAGLDFPWSVAVSDEVTYISNCENFQDGYSLYQVRDDIEVYEAFDYENDGSKITLTSTDGNFKLVIGGIEKGQYDVDMINIKIFDPSFGTQGYAVDCESSDFGCGIEDCHVSHLGESDDWVRVTFAGNVWMQTVNPLTAGTYPVRGILICKVQ